MKYLIAMGLLLALTGCNGIERLGGYSYTIKGDEVKVQADTVYGGPDVVIEKQEDGSSRVLIQSAKIPLPLLAK